MTSTERLLLMTAFTAGWRAHQRQQTASGDSETLHDARKQFIRGVEGNFSDDGTGMSSDEKAWLG